LQLFNRFHGRLSILNLIIDRVQSISVTKKTPIPQVKLRITARKARIMKTGFPTSLTFFSSQKEAGSDRVWSGSILSGEPIEEKILSGLEAPVSASIRCKGEGKSLDLVTLSEGREHLFRGI